MHMKWQDLFPAKNNLKSYLQMSSLAFAMGALRVKQALTFRILYTPIFTDFIYLFIFHIFHQLGHVKRKGAFEYA